MKSSYKEHTTWYTKTFHQTEQKSENQEETQKIKHKLKQNIQRPSMWNQHTYDVGTWTKEKMGSETKGKNPWTSIVNRTPKQNSYPRTINSGQASSLSSLSNKIFITQQKGNKK